jgi:hypothetical protein
MLMHSPVTLAKPFQGKYAGEGLNQKVVERLITFLRYHFNEIEIGFLTKQIQIITKVVSHYYNGGLPLP